MASEVVVSDTSLMREGICKEDLDEAWLVAHRELLELGYSLVKSETDRRLGRVSIYVLSIN
jgi:hypothetical protein